MVSQQRLDYQSYLLRLRRADNAGWPNWWASLESTSNGAHHSFAGLEGLFAFLKTQTGGGMSSSTAQTVVALVESLEAGTPQASLHLARLLQAGWDGALLPLATGIAQRLGVSREAVHEALVGAARDCCPLPGVPAAAIANAHTSAPSPDTSPLVDIAKLQRAEEALRHHNRELSLLNRAIQAVSFSLDLERVFATVLEQVRDLLDVTACSIWLIEQETEELVCRQAVGAVDDQCLALHGAIADQVARSGESLIVPDAGAAGYQIEEIDPPLCSILAVPLRFRESVVGVLQVADEGVDRFAPHDLALLQSLAAAATIAVANARLVETLRQRTRELQVQNEELDAFAHTVAHDLKNPLGLLIGFGSVLEQELAETENETAGECVNAVVETGHKMTNIVDELLLLASVRKMDEVAIKSLDMAAIAGSALQQLSIEVERRQAEIVLPEGWPAALGHGPWVEEVWKNLVSNAIKYGGRPEAGIHARVELGFDASPNRSLADSHIRFWVRDNGAGLAPGERARLFAEFARLHQVRAEGHGLGLSIVRRIVEKLGGRVGVESAVGQGSLFYFTLPAAPGPASRRPGSPGNY